MSRADCDHDSTYTVTSRHVECTHCRTSWHLLRGEDGRWSWQEQESASRFNSLWMAAPSDDKAAKPDLGWSANRYLQTMQCNHSSLSLRDDEKACSDCGRKWILKRDDQGRGLYWKRQEEIHDADALYQLALLGAAYNRTCEQHTHYAPDKPCSCTECKILQSVADDARQGVL